MELEQLSVTMQEYLLELAVATQPIVYVLDFEVTNGFSRSTTMALYKRNLIDYIGELKFTEQGQTLVNEYIQRLGKTLQQPDPRTPAEVAAYEAKQASEPDDEPCKTVAEIATANMTGYIMQAMQEEIDDLKQQLDAARADVVTLTARNQQLQSQSDAAVILWNNRQETMIAMETDLKAAHDALFPLAEVYEEYLVMFEQGHTIDFETWLSECHGLTARFVKAYDVYTSKQS